MVSTKNPRLPGNRGFWKSILCWLEVSSHDATAAMLPNGHLSLGSLAAQANIKRCRHLLNNNASIKYHRGCFVKRFF
jgi:hypothetical protein